MTTLVPGWDFEPRRPTARDNSSFLLAALRNLQTNEAIEKWAFKTNRSRVVFMAIPAISGYDKNGFSLEAQQRARSYQLSKARILALQTAGLALVLWTILLSPVHLDLERQLLRFTADPWAVTAIFVLVGYLLIQFLSVPISYYKGFVAERRVRPSTQTFSSWVRDRIKIVAVGVAVSLVCEILSFVLVVSRLALFRRT